MRRRLPLLADSLTYGLLAAVWALGAAWAARGLWNVALPPAAWRVIAGCWMAAFALGAGVERRGTEARAGRVIGVTAGAHVLACAALAGWLHWRGIRLEGLPAWRCAGLLGMWLLALRAWLWMAKRRTGAAEGAESLRLLVLTGVVALPQWPFFTTNFAGGLDARWYAYVLQDYLQQAHAGVFPVLVGQGPLAFNGALHPFRFAPYFQNFAGLLDWLTAHTLGVFALQHLTVVISGTAAAFAAYACLLGLAPARRWTACLVAAAYVLGPAFWGLISMSDAYMSLMTLPWLPVLFYGVLRIVERRDARSYVLVAVVLSILWTCHPPVALWAMLTALAVLGLAWLASGGGWRGALALAGCLALFGGLSAFYFQGVLEVRPQGSEPAPSKGYAIGVAVWLIAWAAGYFVLRRKAAPPEGSERAAVAARRLIFAGLVSLAVLAAGRRLLPFELHQAIADTLAFLRQMWPWIVLPVTAKMERVSDIQPGYALLLLGVLAIATAWGARQLRLVLLAGAALAYALLLLPVPAISRFLWGHMPMAIVTTTSVAASIRLTPVWGAVLAFGGFLALAWLADKNRLAHRAALVLLVGAVIWSGYEVQKPAQLTRRLTQLAGPSADMLRTENAQLFIYSYNFIRPPSDFSHGVVDYHLASHVLDPATGEPDPGLVAPATPPPGEAMTLTWQYNPANPYGEVLSSSLLLEPGRRIVAHFTFAPPEPHGVLIISGPHFYRDYLLPASGGPRSFGAGPTNTRDLALWNTGSEPEQLTFSFIGAAPLPPVEGPQVFARVEWCTVPDEALPVQTVSLIPYYRVRVEAKAPALLESPRMLIPGYVARRNGRPVEVLPSREARVAVKLAPGPNDVEIRFVGSPGLHRAAWISLLCWAGVAVFGWAEIKRTLRA